MQNPQERSLLTAVIPILGFCTAFYFTTPYLKTKNQKPKTKNQKPKTKNQNKKQQTKKYPAMLGIIKLKSINVTSQATRNTTYQWPKTDSQSTHYPVSEYAYTAQTYQNLPSGP